MKEFYEKLKSLENNVRIDNYGLYTGKMGLCISYYLSGYHFQNVSLKTKGEKLLSEIAENISLVESFDFDSGILGIGWAIEWLSQNKLIEIDTHDFLSELDDELYKLVLYQNAAFIGLGNGTIGRALYLYRRTEASVYNNFYRDLCNRECLVLLLDEIYEKLLSNPLGLLHDRNNDFSENDYKIFSEVLIFLIELLPSKFNISSVKKIIGKLIDVRNINAKMSKQSIQGEDQIFFYHIIDTFISAGYHPHIFFESVEPKQKIVHSCSRNVFADLLNDIPVGNMKVSWKEAWPSYY